MRTEDQGAGDGEPGEQRAAGGLRLHGVDVDAAADLRTGQLHGVVDGVPGDEGPGARTAHLDGDLPGGVPGCGQQAQSVRHLDPLGRYVDQVEQARLLDGDDGVAEHAAPRLVHVVGGPELVLRPRRQVARAREGRHPGTVDLTGVPSDVVGVQMGEDHQIDVLGGEPDVREACEVVRTELVPGGVGPRLAVADPGVDEDAQTVHDQREAVTVEVQDAVRVREVGAQPVVFGDHAGGGGREQPRSGRGRQGHLVDPVDGDVPDGPVGGAGGGRLGELCGAHARVPSSAEDRPTTKAIDSL